MSFSWTPATGLNDTSAFPSKDTGFRARLQALLQQLATYVDDNKANKNPTLTWIVPTLLNGWINFGVPFNGIGYSKDELGYVKLRGFIKSGTVTIGTSILSLPAGYRPLNTNSFIAATNDGTNLYAGTIDVKADGTVSTGANIKNTWLSLDSIPPFKAEQ